MHVVTTAAAAVSLAFAAACAACLAYLHLAPTGYSPLANAVSEYGVGAYARWYRLQATFAGLSGLLLALALRHHGRTAVLLAVFGVARLAIAQYPTDLLGGDVRTRTGGVHLLLAGAAFAAVCWAAVGLKRDAGGLPALGWLAAAGAAGTWLAIRALPLRPILGLLERVFYVAMLAWLALVAARLV